MKLETCFIPPSSLRSRIKLHRLKFPMYAVQVSFFVQPPYCTSNSSSFFLFFFLYLCGPLNSHGSSSLSFRRLTHCVFRSLGFLPSSTPSPWRQGDIILVYDNPGYHTPVPPLSCVCADLVHHEYIFCFFYSISNIETCTLHRLLDLLDSNLSPMKDASSQSSLHIGLLKNFNKVRGRPSTATSNHWNLHAPLDHP